MTTLNFVGKVEGMFPPPETAVVAKYGDKPIMLINGKYYTFDTAYHGYWRCFHVAYDIARRCWYHADDLIYYFDDLGNIVGTEE